MQVGYEVFHDDVNVLVDFYVRVLGFVATDHAPDAGHIVVRRGSVAVGCTQMPGATSTQRRPPHGSEILLRIADLDFEYRRVLDSGYSVADELQQRSWGLADFRVFDPSGQYIRVTTGA